jgi:hypothetical protein
MTEASRAAKIMEKLRQERDELKLKAHLGKAEMRDEWETLERKWEHLEGRMEGVAEEAREASQGGRRGLRACSLKNWAKPIAGSGAQAEN